MLISSLYIVYYYKQSLDLAWKASRELKEYKGFVEVLQFILAMGNFLNAGSRQGGAYGFKLSTLPKVHLCLVHVYVYIQCIHMYMTILLS